MIFAPSLINLLSSDVSNFLFFDIRLILLEHVAYIKLSNGAETMDLCHTQPKLLDAEHAWGRKFQTEKNTFEVRSHVST